MAQKVQIDAAPGGPTAKIRHPVAVPAFNLITLGIYGIYWWYQINREMVDLGRSRNVTGLGDNAFLSLLAVFPGSLVFIPAYVSLYNTVKRIQRAQEVASGQVTLNGMVVLWLIIGSFVFTAGIAAVLVVPGYIQSELNKVWTNIDAGGAEPPPTPGT